LLADNRIGGSAPAANISSRRGFCAGLAASLFALLAAPLAHAAQSLLGKRAPEFTRVGLNGQPIDLSRLRGKVVLLNFWATWCAPCQAEMPVFASWRHRYSAQGFEAVGISMDDNSAAARRAIQHLKIDYPIAMGDERLGSLYGGVLGLPLTFLIDRKGIVRARFQGESSLQEIQKQLEALLAAAK
jgi:peroxiredoxin